MARRWLNRKYFSVTYIIPSGLLSLAAESTWLPSEMNLIAGSFLGSEGAVPVFREATIGMRCLLLLLRAASPLSGAPPRLVQFPLPWTTEAPAEWWRRNQRRMDGSRWVGQSGAHSSGLLTWFPKPLANTLPLLPPTPRSGCAWNRTAASSTL